MFAVIATAVAFVLHVFSDFTRKHSVDIRPGECYPQRWIAWGTFDPDYDRIRYFQLLLPSYKWCLDFRRRRWGFARRALCWSDRGGWEIHYVF